MLTCIVWHALFVACGQPPASLDAVLEAATKAALAKVAPCVVQIQTVGGLEFVGPSGQRVQRGQGPTTGVIVDSDGFLISSSFNFVHKPAAITVLIPGQNKPLPAKIVAHDQTRMLTLLKVEAEKLPVPEVAPKSEIHLGQWALAVGRTWSDVASTPPSVSVGIVSALDRIWGKAIQTDAKVSPVNYGGPLIDLQGRVMGILVPLSPRGDDELAGVEWYDSGIGFAIPMEDVQRAWPKLKAGKDLVRGVLGYRPKSDNDLLGEAEIGSLDPDGPAAKAGLQEGDRIVAADGVPIERQSQMRHILGPKYAGDKVSLTIKRGEETKEFKDIELAPPPTGHQFAMLGILPVRDDGDPGVEVRYVLADSPAAKAGIKVGDRLIALAGRPLAGRQQLRMILDRLSPGTELKLDVHRKDGDKRETLNVRLAALSAEVPADDLKPATKGQALAQPQPLAAGPMRPGGRAPGKGPPPPKAEPAKPAVEPAKVAKGFLPRKDPTLGRTSWVYVPENYDANIAHALVIWLHPKGEPLTDAIRRIWEPLCQEHHLILYAPQAEHPSGWLTSEVEGIVNDVRELIKTYTIDRDRIVAHGLGEGASLAIFLAFDARDLIRGVVAVGGSLAQPPKEPEAGRRLAFLLFAGARDPGLAAAQAAKTQLVEARHPVVAEEVPGLGTGYPTDAAVFKKLLRWLESLDRL